MILLEQFKPSQRRSSPKKRSPFVVLNTDNGYGVYMRAINATMKEKNLVPSSRGRKIERIQTNDVLVVGDSDSIFNYDFRVVKSKNIEELASLDSRSFKVYSSVKDLQKIVQHIEKYATQNNLPSFGNVRCFYYEEPKPKKKCRRVYLKEEEEPTVNIKVNVRQDDVIPVFKKKDLCRYKRVYPSNINEKAQIFSDWVKIGMHQFDIEVDTLGNEFIRDARRNRYYIEEDRYGRRFLVTR